MSTAIVGAGLAGLSCARELPDAVIFDKARGPSGRMSSKRTPHGSFDLGVQLLYARTVAFGDQLAAWTDRGLLAPYRGRLGVVQRGEWRARTLAEVEHRPGPFYVPVPRSSLLGRSLAQGRELRASTRIVAIERNGAGWRLRSEAGDEGTFDRVVVATPAPQAAPLLAAAPELQARVADVAFTPVWAAWVRGAESLEAPLDAAWVDGGPLAWIRRREAVAERPEGPGWVVQASPEWTAEHLEDSFESVADALAAALAALFPEGTAFPKRAAHRWRYGLVERAAGEPFLEQDGLFVCGDGCLGRTAESAWLSGRALGQRLS